MKVSQEHLILKMRNEPMCSSLEIYIEWRVFKQIYKGVTKENRKISKYEDV